MPQGNTPSDVEWIGGLTILPVETTAQSPQYRPEALLWLRADGMIVGQELATPGQLLARASEHLRRSMQKPLEGPSPPPTRLRVATTELADSLRAGHPGLQIVVAPTPEIDELVAALALQFSHFDDDDGSYLSRGTTPDEVGAFFRAAAQLWRAAPWTRLDAHVVQVSSKELGLINSILYLVGAPGGRCGWLLFPSHEAFLAFAETSEAEDPSLPSLALNFERHSDLSDSERDEISKHAWELATPEACPMMSAVDEHGDPVAPNALELHQAEAVCFALAAFVENGTPGFAVNVPTHSGEVRVLLTEIEGGPEPAAEEVELDGPADLNADHVLARLFRLHRNSQHHSDEAADLNEELVGLFEDSREAKTLGRVEFIPRLIDYADEIFDVTIADVGPAELSELVFTVFPERGVSSRPELERVVLEVRAFYEFLKREFGLRQADDCLLVVGAGAMAILRGTSTGQVGSGRRKPSGDSAAKKKKRKEAKKSRRKNR